jgi:hypothetical protein
MMAVNSDLMAESLEVYTAVKQYRDKIPGLSVTADNMAQFFKKPKKYKKGTIARALFILGGRRPPLQLTSKT